MRKEFPLLLSAVIGSVIGAVVVLLVTGQLSPLRNSDRSPIPINSDLSEQQKRLLDTTVR